jgi:hypothetical protein
MTDAHRLSRPPRGPLRRLRLGAPLSPFAALSPSERRGSWAVSKAKWLCGVAGAVGVLAAVAATPAFSATIASTTGFGFSAGGGLAASPLLSFPAGGPGPTANSYIATRRNPTPISAAAAFVLPSATKCVSGDALTLQVRKLAHVTWTGATVKVNGNPFKTIKRSQITRPTKLTGLPTRKFVLSITAKTSNRRSATATRTYKPCATKTVKPSSISPGSYSGDTSPGYALRFYVSAGGTQLQDITIQAVGLGCTPGGSYDDQSFSIPAIAIAANGSFTTTTTQSGVIDNSPATIAYTFSGHFNGTSVAGQVRDGITYNNGTAHSCTSNNLSWSATRDTQGSQTASAPPAGSYSGDTSPGYALRFYVSAGGTQLQDITIQAVGLGCTPGGSYDDQSFSIPAIAIAANGSFTTTTTETGVINGAAATITYTFSGHFHGTNSSGVERAAGQVRDAITYNNGTAYSCTSNNLSWSAT